MQNFWRRHNHGLKITALFCAGLFLLLGAVMMLWAATFKVPSLESIRERRVVESTKIFDSTGEILLYDTGGNVRRSIIPVEDISRHIKNATIAIEDDQFYSHHGVRPTAFLRAI